MLNIKFKIDKDMLSRIMISLNAMPTETANYLWLKYNSSYRLIQQSITSEDIDQNIIKELQQQSFFSETLLQAKENCKRVEKIWETKQLEINNYLKDIIRIDFSLNMTAYIVSPSMHVGVYLGNNCFAWGHSNGLKDNNYDLVYLVHESLHSFFESDNVSHAIIENISDIELSKILNNKKIGYKCHNFTKEEHIKIFPFWNLYLNKSKKEIKEEQDILNIQYDIESVEHYREKISKMNIKEFIEFVKSKIGSIKLNSFYQLIVD